MLKAISQELSSDSSTMSALKVVFPIHFIAAFRPTFNRPAKYLAEEAFSLPPLAVVLRTLSTPNAPGTIIFPYLLPRYIEVGNTICTVLMRVFLVQRKVGKLDRVVSELRLQRAARSRGGRGRLAGRQMKGSVHTGERRDFMFCRASCGADVCSAVGVL